VQAIVASSCISQRSARNVVQAEGVVQFSAQQQTAVRTDLGTMEFQPHTTVKSKLNASHFACTLWVIHYLPPSVG
jgi:hypothetical protein